MLQTNNEAIILLALQTYKKDQNLSLRRAAKLYQVNYTTLLCRHNGVQARANTIPKSRKLSNLEKKIVYSVYSGPKFTRISPLLLSGAEEMASRLLAGRHASPVGKRWARNSVKQHEELDTRLFS